MAINDPVTQARVDLTTALRAAVRHGLNEGVCNHFSMAVPGRPDLFLVNPQGLHWSEITPSDIVMADGDGNILEGRHPMRPRFYIHARITPAILPPPWCRTICPTRRRFASIPTAASRCVAERAASEPHRLRRRLWRRGAQQRRGRAHAAPWATRIFCSRNGIIVSGPTAQAYDDLYYLERAAMVQVLAMQTGRPLHNLRRMAARTNRQMAGENQQSIQHFESLKRVLDRDEPGWRRLTA